MRLNAPRVPGLLLVLLAVGVRAGEPSNGPDGATLAQAAKSVVQVIASGCAGDEGDRAGSGFVLGKDGLIVTDLHVVVGCKTLQAKYQGVDQLPATVVHVLKGRDLALLKVDHPPAVPGLELSKTPPQVKEELDVIGFPLGLPAYDNSSLHVTLATETTPELRAALRQQELDQLKAVGFPSLDTQVIRVDGNLLPGHSGAPLINYQGYVAGVGSGGLERGTVGIGWAIRAQYVDELLNSNEALPGGTSGITSVAFAATMPSTGTDDRTVKCGELSLVRRRLVPVGAMIKSADDPAKLRGLIQDLTSVPVEQLENDRFAIWTEPRSGAGIALPAGLHIDPGPQYCTIRTGAPTVNYLISLKPLPLDTNNAAWELAANREAWLVVHQALAVAGANALVNDARHSVVPRVENGGIVQRNMATGRGQGGSPVRVFTNNLTGRGAFISIFVVNQNAKAEPADMTEREKLAWTRGLLAVNFAAFPPLTGADGQDPQDGSPQAEDIALPGARAYPRIRCGDAAFIPLAPPRTLGDLASPTPNPPDLLSLVQTQTGMGLAQISGSQFDIWVQPTRGATVFLPHGAQWEADQQACHIPTGTSAISYTLRVVKPHPGDVPAEAWQQQIEADRNAFAHDLAQAAGVSVQPDPVSRFDAQIPPNGDVAGYLLGGTRPDGGHALIYIVALRRDRVLTLFAMTDLKADVAANLTPADRTALAQGLAAIRLSTLAP